MRIAFVAPFGLRARGTTRARALPLGRELARRGHAVALFIPPYDSPQDSGRRWWDGGVATDAIQSSLDDLGYQPANSFAAVDVINIALPRFVRGSAAWHLWLAWRLLRAVVAWRPDVVHVFKPKGPSGLVAAALWWTRGRGEAETRRVMSESHRVTVSPCHPVTLSPRPLVSLSTCLLVIDSDDWEGPGGWNDDPRAGYTPLMRRFFAWQERFGLSHADAWTVASECLRDRAIRFGAVPDCVFVLPNGVSACKLQTANCKLQTANCKLQTANCRMHESSSVICHLPFAICYTRFAGVRPAEVAAIWALVREKMPEAALTVVGRGLAAEEQELVGLPGIEVTGWVEPEKMLAIFAKTGLAMIPWADTPANRARSSVKVRELMAAGLPIVAYAVGELPATLGDAAVLVPPRDVAAFADAVVALIADPARARCLAAAARAKALAEFDWAKPADVALSAYRAAGAESKA